MARAGSSADQAAPKQSAAEARRLKKANGLMEGLMKTLQLSRTQALVARRRKEGGLKQKLKQLEDVELRAVSTMSSLQDNPPTVDVLDSLQDEVLAHKATLKEAWGLNKRSIEAASGSDSKIQEGGGGGPSKCCGGGAPAQSCGSSPSGSSPTARGLSFSGLMGVDVATRTITLASPTPSNPIWIYQLCRLIIFSSTCPCYHPQRPS